MLSNLQILRAFAALNVVLFHILEIGSEHGFGIPILEPLRGWGKSGVDIFFVLSGFIMVYIAELRPRSPFEFIKGRIERLVPIYWILTLVVVAIALLLGEFRGSTLSFDAIVSSFFFVSTWITGDLPLLYVGWTLEWEMLFYLIFAVGLILKTRTSQLLFPIACLFSFVVLLGQNPIIVEFTFGMICAKLVRRQDIKDSAGLLTLTGASLMISSVFIDYGLPQFLTWGLPSALLVLGLVNLKQWKFWLGEHLGDASYSIYLVQVFTIPAFYKMAAKLVPELPALVLAAGCLAGTAMVGSLVHLVAEKPIQRFINKRKADRRANAGQGLNPAF